LFAPKNHCFIKAMAIEAEVSSAYLVNRTLLHMQSQFSCCLELSTLSQRPRLLHIPWSTRTHLIRDSDFSMNAGSDVMMPDMNLGCYINW